MLAQRSYTNYLPGFLAGAAAGATASFLTFVPFVAPPPPPPPLSLTSSCCSYPLDIIRARLASQVENRLYTGVWHGMRQMYINEGLASFAKGMSPTLIGVLPYAGISFGTNDSLKKLYIKHFAPNLSERQLPTTVRLVAGAIAGLVAQTGTRRREEHVIMTNLSDVPFGFDSKTNAASWFPLLCRCFVRISRSRLYPPLPLTRVDMLIRAPWMEW